MEDGVATDAPRYIQVNHTESKRIPSPVLKVLTLKGWLAGSYQAGTDTRLSVHVPLPLAVESLSRFLWLFVLLFGAPKPRVPPCFTKRVRVEVTGHLIHLDTWKAQTVCCCIDTSCGLNKYPPSVGLHASISRVIRLDLSLPFSILSQGSGMWLLVVLSSILAASR